MKCRRFTHSSPWIEGPGLLAPADPAPEEQGVGEMAAPLAAQSLPWWQLLSKPRDAQNRSDRGCRAPPCLCHNQVCRLCPWTSGVSFMSPLPPHHPNPFLGDGGGHRPAGWGSAALHSRGGSGEGQVKVTPGTTKKGDGGPDLGGSQQKDDVHSQLTRPGTLRAERLAQRGRRGRRSPGSKHLSFGCPSPVSFLCFKPPAKVTVSTTMLHNLLWTHFHFMRKPHSRLS